MWLGLMTRLRFDRSGTHTPSDVEYVDLASFYGKEHAISSDNHLTNLLRELVVLGCEWEPLWHKSKLCENRRS